MCPLIPTSLFSLSFNEFYFKIKLGLLDFHIWLDYSFKTLSRKRGIVVQELLSPFLSLRDVGLQCPSRFTATTRKADGSYIQGGGGVAHSSWCTDVALFGAGVTWLQ